MCRIALLKYVTQNCACFFFGSTVVVMTKNNFSRFQNIKPVGAMTVTDYSFCSSVDPNKVDQDVTITSGSCWYYCGCNEGVLL